MDLWKPLPKAGEGPPQRLVESAGGAGPQKDDAVPGGQRRHRDTATAAPAMPVNGTELLWTRRSGAGEE